MNKKKILLVDDSDLVSDMLISCFEESGYNVVRAKNGIDGIKKVYSEIPDIIIMDVEMPLLQGYQASRLLKNKRGVKDIPIIMHTSHTEDKDKFWAITSGADAFICKSYDNLNLIQEKVKEFENHPTPDINIIKEDGKKINDKTILELITNLYDKQLFQSTILNQLNDISKNIGSLSITINNILKILDSVCETHIAVVIIMFNNQPLAFIKPQKNIYKNDVEDFFNICFNDFFKCFNDINLDKTEKIILNISERDDFDKIRLDNMKISSYINYELKGKGASTIGMVHIGNFNNNYFTDYISSNIQVFINGAGIILENAILFNQVTEMEDKIRTVFSKFVPKEIIDDLIEKQSHTSLLIGEKRKVTILFSDIRSFTTISEENKAEDIVEFLNNYFEIMCSIIKKYGGTVDKLIGDAMLAVFGAPISYEDNTLRAVNASIEMINSLKKIDTKKINLSGKALNIGIGIHEGDVIVGNIGSKDKFDYTIIGDNVNLASRLEGLTKHYREKIIISESVKKKIENKFFLRKLDKVKVKGKDKSTDIYGIVIDKEKFTDNEIIKNYDKALDMYYIQNWKTAIEYFELVIKKIPDDFLSHMYIKRCMDFEKKSFSKDWDGSVDLDFK